MRHLRKSGFTLVELLVVIGIIGVLISLLLPALGRARAEAKRAVCLSNLRTLGQCYLLYVQENKGRGLISKAYSSPPPPGATDFTAFWFAARISYPSGPKWDIQQGYLAKFFKNPAFLNCPSAADSFRGYTGLDISFGDVTLTSYGYNASVNHLSQTAGIKNTAETMLLADAVSFIADGSAAPGTLSGVYFMEEARLTSKKPTFHGRHAKKGSVLWFDGHATSETPYVTLLDGNLDGTWASPGAKEAMYKQRIGYLTPVNVREIDLFSNFNTKNSLNYWFWADKTARK